MNCMLCNKEFANVRNLSIHLAHSHKISTKDYYDKYLFDKNVDGKCVICNKPTTFQNLGVGYHKYCSKACVNKSENHRTSVFNSKYIKYGNGTYNNPDKFTATWNSKSEQEIDAIKHKRAQTIKNRYGDSLWNQNEKYKQSCLNSLGVDNPFKSSKIQAGIANKYLNKTPEEKLEIVHKRKHTIDMKSDEEKQIIAQKHRDAYNIKSDEEKHNIQEKSNYTKRKNGTFNTSKAENKCYKQLLLKFKEVKTQYKDERYPFNCDFYIPEKDLFIECNFHWTHGKHIFSGSGEDQAIIEHWKNKNTKYFDNAINTWSVRDVLKYKYAKANKLNYLTFYTQLEFDNWLQTL